MRVVLDTGILIAALITTGTPVGVELTFIPRLEGGPNQGSASAIGDIQIVDRCPNSSISAVLSR